MTSAPGEPPWVATVLHFWFEEVGPRLWFAGERSIDAKVLERFSGLHEMMTSQAELEDLASSPRTALAAVLVLDQFSRHLFRDTSRAYATDPIARRLTHVAIDRGFDLGMTAEERQFLYMPLQHSEDLADQALSVRLFRALGNDDWTQYAVAHYGVIEKFGRFPHRNAIVGRDSTPDERDALASGSLSF
jgi:uncharacterized protein (DUF924 family)